MDPTLEEQAQPLPNGLVDLPPVETVEVAGDVVAEIVDPVPNGISVYSTGETLTDPTTGTVFPPLQAVVVPGITGWIYSQVATNQMAIVPLG